MIHKSQEANCKPVTWILCDYLEGRLDTASMHRLQRHTRYCRACRLVLDSARATIAAYYSSVMTPTPTPNVPKAA